MYTMKTAVMAAVPVLLLLACNFSLNNNSKYDAAMEIRYNDYRQEIDGFGGSNAWTGLPQNAVAANEVVRLLYSRTEGAGFTILRNRIPFRERLAGDADPNLNDGFVVRNSDNNYDYTASADGTKTFNLNWNSWDLAGTRNLISRIKSLDEDGPEKLIVMSSPWTPPNNRVTQWKEDVTGVSDRLNYAIDWNTPDWWGRLKRDKYDDYADLLADYAKNFEEKMGAPLAVLSVQNEPNWKVNYESCYWNGVDIRDFLKVIGQRFPQKGISPGAGGLGIMAPEYENFDIDFNAMIKPSLDDPDAKNVLTHIALHQYNGGYDSSDKAGAKAFPGITASGKRFWQTEVSGSGPHLPQGNGIDNALYYARMIHFDMTLAETNAFLYWWLWTGSPGEDFSGCLIRANGSTVTAAMRLYAMGQYSRFIRPGWKRIASTTSPAAGIYSSAYRNPSTNEIAVVLVNDSNAAATVALNLQEVKFTSLKAWRTSATEKLAPLGDQALSGGSAAVNLPPKSISTFYGTTSRNQRFLANAASPVRR